jgi:RNA polymerase sigma-70 factor (sigma-E family)
MVMSARWEAPPSFDVFIQERHRALLRFALVLSGDPLLAEDLVQDALEHVGIRWWLIRRRDDPEGYIRRTIINRFLNNRRARRREDIVDAVPDQASFDPVPRDEALWRQLASLPRHQRAVLVLRFFEDMTEAQVAEVLGCSVGAVKTSGSRGLAKLRAIYSQEASP